MLARNQSVYLEQEGMRSISGVNTRPVPTAKSRLHLLVELVYGKPGLGSLSPSQQLFTHQ